MHTLTKIFIVLQALLSIFILALVVPLAVNKDHWQAETQKLEGALKQATSNLNTEQVKHAATEQQHLNDLDSQKDTILSLQQEINTSDQRLIDVRSRLGDAEIAATESRAQIDTLSASVNTLSQIIEEQGEEITTRRNDSLETQKRSIELEDSLRDALLRLQVAVQGTKILQEQLTRAQEGDKPGAGSGTAEQQYLTSPLVKGQVLQLEQDGSGTRYAIVDLGSRDGLAENMRFMLSRDTKFVGYLVLTTVDINRSVGRIELEQPEGVQVSDTVIGGVD